MPLRQIILTSSLGKFRNDIHCCVDIHIIYASILFIASINCDILVRYCRINPSSVSHTECITSIVHKDISVQFDLFMWVSYDIPALILFICIFFIQGLLMVLYYLKYPFFYWLLFSLAIFSPASISPCWSFGGSA